jgi:hypothetical protein
MEITGKSVPAEKSEMYFQTGLGTQTPEEQEYNDFDDGSFIGGNVGYYVDDEHSYNTEDNYNPEDEYGCCYCSNCGKELTGVTPSLTTDSTDEEDLFCVECVCYDCAKLRDLGDKYREGNCFTKIYSGEYVCGECFKKIY